VAPPRRSALAAGLGATALVALVAAGTWLWLRPAAAPTPPEPLPSLSPTSSPLPSPQEAATVAPRTTPTPEAAPTPVPARPAPVAATPKAPPPTPASTAMPDAPLAAPGLGAEARLLRAEDLVRRGRWAEALAEARAVLDARPTSSRATVLAQQAEAELVIDECLRSARRALEDGDRELALAEVRRGFLIRMNDPRLLAMHREVVQQ
jgi:type IV secretory pathway VirB10-like protein